jgi:hypothetical protein
MGFWWDSDFGKKFTPAQKAAWNNEFSNVGHNPPGCIQFFLYPALVLLGLGFLASLFGWGG